MINFARTPEQWADGSNAKGGDAHGFFDAVRRVTLQQEKLGHKNRLYSNVLMLAENVAKVTYNSYGYDAPFDHDAGWWIPANLKKIVEAVNDPGFSAIAWATLTSGAYIELEAAIRCNPYCHTCCWLMAFEIAV